MRSSRTLLVGYILLLIALLGVDQTTKFHAEKNFLDSFDTHEIRNYHSTKERVLTWGISPSYANENRLSPADVTHNWLDFHLTYVRNPGAAWGSFSNMPEPYRKWVFYLVTLVASAFVLNLFRTSAPGLRLMRTALVFIFAGAMGNFLDRLAMTYVIDWLQFHWRIFGWEYAFPVFNIADVCINVGIGLMLVDALVNAILVQREKRVAAIA